MHHTASANTAKDHLLLNDDARITRLDAAVADINAASSTQIKSDATSSRKTKAKASKAGAASGMQSRVRAALADQASLPPADDQRFYDVHRVSNCAGG